MLAGLGSPCSAPIGALGEVVDDLDDDGKLIESLSLRGVAADIRWRARAPPRSPERPLKPSRWVMPWRPNCSTWAPTRSPRQAARAPLIGSS